ncbi:hypothetical protein J7355_05120 [Endozoicomonas sp. G2_2]|uniref:hypothetical protein n=1 Tax=Endozoicomonas sp. G2_2 TaxID=2821092 RepID=UPI001ADADF42|nr:hypothetical protein [Endozoicomonas sp. G2_2]MBO9469472.1 hypothetical protein [Endozoicomonas sp. G2_2]
MKIQEIVSDVRSRVGTAGKHYQDAFKAYFDAQRKAVGVVTKNGQTLANTEIGAAKNLFAAAKSSFDKARTDGVRKVANNPQAYVPNGRDQIVSAYKDTIDLLVQTGNELSSVVTSGYKSVIGKLSGETQKKAGTRKTTTRKTSSAGSRKASTAKSASTKTTAAKRKTASTRKTASSASKSASTGSTTRKRTTAKKSSTASASASSNSANSDSSAS